ncbi:anti-virulence regulator CigR family protein [Enterobacter kobei]|uniref:anti-virulence regulator CigR family protein n=1 Tax=Enterobacter kobei TaxID=208224 RepID=UPI0028D446D5|nr:anti-virulence regulator CigR family protein [Enterobacter kobei]WNP33158.1 anti-virulence regulator CigR family protein [Enterobacter kobei]
MHLRRFNTLTLAVVLSLSFISAPVMANPGNGNHGGNHGNSANHGHAEHGNQGKADKKNVSDDVSVRLSYDRARSLAVNYGLTGYDSLPPGIAKNLARGKPLPPGIAKKMVPASMLGQLPSYPGYEWRIAGDDLVLIALSTAIVTAVINGVFE